MKHVKTYYLTPARAGRYTIRRTPSPGAIPVETYTGARAKQAELNVALPAPANGFKTRPAGSGRKKSDDPTHPVTLRIPESVLNLYPKDVQERNRRMVAAIANNSVHE